MLLDNNCMLEAGRKKDWPVSQNGKTYRLMNEQAHHIELYQVENCLIKENDQKKCDYLFIINQGGPVNSIYLVELKGKGLVYALKQLESSVKYLGADLEDHTVFGRVVGKRVTPNIKSRRARLDEMLKLYRGNLKICTGND